MCLFFTKFLTLSPTYSVGSELHYFQDPKLRTLMFKAWISLEARLAHTCYTVGPDLEVTNVK